MIGLLRILLTEVTAESGPTLDHPFLQGLLPEGNMPPSWSA
jgi:hypothetical protein